MGFASKAAERCGSWGSPGKERGVIHNEDGRVLDDTGTFLPGVYVTGWVKRGPRGVIGSNRACAADTVAHLLTDFETGRLQRHVADTTELKRLLDERGVTPLSYRD